jgi:hypothetical protein
LKRRKNEDIEKKLDLDISGRRPLIYDFLFWEKTGGNAEPGNG